MENEVGFWSRLKGLLVYDPSNPLLFNSGFFLLTFLFFMLFYFLVRNRIRLRIIYLTLFSLFFFYKASGMYFLLLLLAATVDYNLSRWIHASEDPVRRKSLLVFSVVINLGLLAYFKYTNLFIDTFNGLGWTHLDPMDILLPIGISFYTFENLSYTIDVYRRRFEPAINFLDYCFFISFFPKLVAGPIVRAADFIPQIRSRLQIDESDLGRAIFLIVGGLFKKAVISDYISTNFVDRVFDSPALYSGFENLMAVYGYALQIYCDFSGYSDMAIGLALMMGFRIPMNFDAPYQSTSITEFWRRWHISLSTWLRDYLYISLGGNRVGKLRQYFNLLTTMLLGGLWHGANWKFVVWGGLHGAALAIEKAFMAAVKLPSSKMFKVLGGLLTFHFVCFCWIFFRASSFENASAVIAQMTGSFDISLIPDVLSGYSNVALLMVFGYVLHLLPRRIDAAAEERLASSPLIVKSLVLAATIYIVIQVRSAGIQPFIYFQF